MGYKLCTFCENHATDMPLPGVYIPHFDQISVKISVLGSYTFIVVLMGVKFGTDAKFHPHRCNVSPLRGEKRQNRPLSNLNNRRFALCAMLPVKYKRQFSNIQFNAECHSHKNKILITSETYHNDAGTLI